MKKIPLCGRIWRICLIFSVAFVSYSFAWGQHQPVTLKVDNATLSQVISEISRQTHVSIAYSKEAINLSKRVSLNVKERRLDRTLETLLRGTNIGYKFSEGRVLLFKKETSSLPQDVQNRYVVSGVVKDENGETMPAVTVKVKGTKLGNLTGVEGTFQIEVPQKKGVLQVSCIGFASQEVPFSVDKPVTIVMKESINTLGEVKVVAYGSRNTREIVGAVGSIKAKELQDTPVPSIETLLQGQLSGVEVSNLSGSPGGGGSQVVVRGYSSLGGFNNHTDASPLYVIDGVPVRSTTDKATGGINPLSSLDPSTIESVEVLKDAASAALYGSRASNGVILVTTKKGKAGRSQFDVNVSQSMTWLPETPLQILGAGERRFHALLAKNQIIGRYNWETDKVVIPEDYKDVWGWGNDDGAYDFFWNNGLVIKDHVPAILQDSLNTFYNNKTNWWDYAFRLGKITKADVLASGGTENIRYMVGGGVYDETGIMLSSSFRRASFTTSLDMNLLPKLTAFSRIYLSYTDRTAGTDMGKIQGLTIDPKGTSTLLPGKGSTAEREALRRLADIDQKNGNYNIRLNLGATLELLKGLKFTSTAALDHYYTRLNQFYPDYLSYRNYSRSYSLNSSMTMVQNENLLNYKAQLAKKHNVDLLAGVSFTKEKTEMYSGEGNKGPANSVHFVSTIWPSIIEEEGSYIALKDYRSAIQEQVMLSFLGRVAYNYDKKYLFEATFRRDGSSSFGRDVRWANFPSLALGWAFSEEKLMEDMWWLSFGKVRASWGRSGKKFDDPYLAQGIMGEGETFLGNVALIPVTVGNSRLTWEKSDQYDVGLDIQLMDYRYKITLDYYYKYSSALIMQTPLPGDVYFASSSYNNGSELLNQGLELDFSADIIRDKKFNWTLSFNTSRNWNMFMKSYNGFDLDDKVLGRPIFGIYTYADEGLVQSEEDIPYYYNARGKKMPLYFGNENYPLGLGGRKIKDQNNDGRINADDLYYAGSTIPLAFGGINNFFTWNGFSLSVLMNYSIGRKVMNMVKGNAFNFTKQFGVIMDDFRQATFWEKPGDQTDYPALRYADNGYVGQFDGDIDSRIENVSFIRLKQMTLSYNIPESFVGKLGLKQARIYLSGENLLLLSNYSGLDPELINPYTGKDNGDAYPLNRKVTLGLNLKF